MAPSVGVAEYYKGKSIFITGATGFMGKVLVEKLLRCCPDLKKIYLLMRPKKGNGVKERLDDFLNVQAFDKLRNEYPERLQKLHLVPGDILSEDLGVSIKDREEVQRECHIVFHCAASVRFDMFLRDAVNVNTLGTKKVLELAEGIKNLEVFVHVSTSYCHCELSLLEEQLYPSKHKPQHVIQCTSWMDDELLQRLEPTIIEPEPNTYSYTKSLTEDLVSQYAGKFPIAIARPSIVIAAYKEPMPGWVDNLNGPTGLIVGAGKGVIRTMLVNAKHEADLIPVDLAVNACIVLAYTTGIEKPKDVQIYNLTQSGINSITWGEAVDMGRLHFQEFPFSMCLWYPGGSPKSSRIRHQIALFFTHLLPAYFIDLLLFLLGKKTFMIKIQKRINYGLDVLQNYTMKEWHFKNDNYEGLRQKLSKEDDDTFYTDIRVLDWNMYIRDYVKGAREYCCKEDPATIPQARKLYKQLYFLDKTMQVILFTLFGYFVYYNLIVRIFPFVN